MPTTRWILAACLTVMACADPGEVRRAEAQALFMPAELDFGEVPVGEWRELDLRIHNTGRVWFRAAQALKLDDNPSFVVEHEGTWVPPYEWRTVKVRFHPLAEGTLSDRVRVVTDADLAGSAVVPVLSHVRRRFLEL